VENLSMYYSKSIRERLVAYELAILSDEAYFVERINDLIKQVLSEMLRFLLCKGHRKWIKSG
jgi:hypothetical protein